MKKMTDGFMLQRPRVIKTRAVAKDTLDFTIDDLINQTLLPDYVTTKFTEIKFDLKEVNGANNQFTLRIVKPNGDLVKEFTLVRKLSIYVSRDYIQYPSGTITDENGVTLNLSPTNIVRLDTSDQFGIPSMQATIYGIR